MYKILLFILLGVTPFTTAVGQSVITPALTDTLMLSEVENRDQVFYLNESDEPVTAVVVDYFESGQIKSRKTVIAGKAEGLWVEWYESGIPKYLAEWTQGMGHGQWVYFYENGEIRERSHVEQDLWQGIAEGWHSNGVKAFEGMYIENERIGRWTWWDDQGAITESKTYQNR